LVEDKKLDLSIEHDTENPNFYIQEDEFRKWYKFNAENDSNEGCLKAEWKIMQKTGDTFKDVGFEDPLIGLSEHPDTGK